MESSYTKRYIILIYLGLIIATLVAYEPIRFNEFISYDDPHYITENTRIMGGITGESLRWAFTTFDAANWHPLTWLSHILDYQLFGLNPQGHHLVNLLFHLASTLLLFWVLKSMTRAIWPSLIVAAAFALHPLHVESVAWAAERKDVLSTFFWMLTMAAYVRYARGPSIGKYFLVVLFFAIGLTAKPMLVTLPFVLLLLDWWPLSRFQGGAMGAKELPSSPSCDEGYAQATLPRLILEKIPLLALVIASCIVTYLAQQSTGAVESVETLSVKCRMGNALVSYVGYINKMFYPDDLAIIYPLLLKLPGTQQLIFCLLELIAISAAVVYFRRQGYLLMGWLWYLGTLIPVIGLVQVGSIAMADRYTYVPSIGIFIMAAWGGGQILAKWRYKRMGIPILVGIILIAMVAGTRKQVKYWRNSLSLYEHAQAVTHNNYQVHYNQGVALADLGRYAEAIEAYKEANRINPNFTKVYLNLGVAFSELGRHPEAIDSYRQFTRIEPNNAMAHYNLGISNSNLRRYQKAAEAFNDALRINPEYIEAQLYLGITYGNLGRFKEAIGTFKKTISIHPEDAKAHYLLGIAFYTIGDKASARQQYNILKKINSDLANKLSILINQ